MNVYNVKLKNKGFNIYYMTYPRGITKRFEPFDPIKLSIETEKIVIDGNKRKYNTFRTERFYGQIATARGVGCNLRCSFCWINESRDYPENYGKFCSPEEVYENLIEASSSEYGRASMSSLARISGCEPTLGKEHLLSVVEICKEKGEFKHFLIETNGIILGDNKEVVKELKKFGDYLTVRLSFKGGTAEDFEKKTGAKAEYFELQFKALEYLKDEGIMYRLASMSSDPKIMGRKERAKLLERIVEQNPGNLKLLEEETADPFEITKRRLYESRLIKKADDLKKRVYEPFWVSITRELKIKRGTRTKISKEELIEVIRNMKMRTVKSSCSSCTQHNPWHGHETQDDLDDKLG